MINKEVMTHVVKDVKQEEYSSIASGSIDLYRY